MALDALTASLKVDVQWTAQKTITGNSNALKHASRVSKEADNSIVSGSGNTASGIGDQLCSFVTTISASSSTTLDLSSLTNILQQTSQTIARIKGVLIELLSSAQDATSGTACSSITIGGAASNQWISQSGSGGPGDASSLWDIPNGEFLAFSCKATTGTVVDGTHKSLKILNNDATYAAGVRITILGAGS